MTVAVAAVQVSSHSGVAQIILQAHTLSLTLQCFAREIFCDRGGFEGEREAPTEVEKNHLKDFGTY